MLFYNRISRVPKGFAASAFFLQLKSVHRSGINGRSMLSKLRLPGVYCFPAALRRLPVIK